MALAAASFIASFITMVHFSSRQSGDLILECSDWRLWLFLCAYGLLCAELPASFITGCITVEVVEFAEPAFYRTVVRPQGEECRRLPMILSKRWTAGWLGPNAQEAAM